MKHVGTVTLYTPRLTLRRYTMNDVDAAFDGWMSDPEVARYVTWEAHPDKEVSREVIRVWVEQYSSEHFYHWAIELDGELIGDIAVVMGNGQHEHVEIGYCMARKYWGQGLMTEATARVLRFMFQRMEMHRVFARHDALNPASGRVMQKCGMLHEGTMREHFRRKDGTYADMPVYGILRQDWEAAHPEAVDGQDDDV